MPLISLVVTLVIVGLILYFIGMLPLDPTIHTIIRVVVILAVVIYLLQLLDVVSIPLRLR